MDSAVSARLEPKLTIMPGGPTHAVGLQCFDRSCGRPASGTPNFCTFASDSPNSPRSFDAAPPNVSRTFSLPAAVACSSASAERPGEGAQIRRTRSDTKSAGEPACHLQVNGFVHAEKYFQVLTLKYALEPHLYPAYALAYTVAQQQTGSEPCSLTSPSPHPYHILSLLLPLTLCVIRL